MWPDYSEGRRIEAEIRSGEMSLFNQDLLERDINAEMLLEGMEILQITRAISKCA